MRHGSLFSGIGGAELAASWIGWENIFHCEINKYNQKLLKQHFPQSIGYEDIKTTDFTIHRGGIDILTGGFPCQPFSTAGKRKGTEDDRNLWPEMLRAIREISPRWIVGENVRGLTNWNGGMVFDQVQADMEAESYEIIPFLFPACAVNAPHRRDRMWFISRLIANPISNGFGWCEKSKERFNMVQDRVPFNEFNPFYESRLTTNTESERLEGRNGSQRTIRFEQRIKEANWENWPTQSPICGRNDGIPNRVDRIKGLGNAWVPQAAMQIFKAIEQYELLTPTHPSGDIK